MGPAQLPHLQGPPPQAREQQVRRGAEGQPVSSWEALRVRSGEARRRRRHAEARPFVRLAFLIPNKYSLSCERFPQRGSPNGKASKFTQRPPPAGSPSRFYAVEQWLVPGTTARGLSSCCPLAGAAGVTA